MRIRYDLFVASAVGLALCLASPAEAKSVKPKKHATMHRHGAAGSAFQGGVLVGPLYNGQDYLGDDPDPNIRAYLLRDLSGRYGGAY
jgi:hypothetical protein